MWDACSDAATTFGKADLSEDIAWVVENDLVLDSIIRETDLQSQIEVKYKSKAVNYQLPENSEDPVEVTLEDGSCLTTDLIVSQTFLYQTGLNASQVEFSCWRKIEHYLKFLVIQPNLTWFPYAFLWISIDFLIWIADPPPMCSSLQFGKRSCDKAYERFVSPHQIILNVMRTKARLKFGTVSEGSSYPVW